MTDHAVVVAPTRVEQLEQALVNARDYIADLQRRHEAAERSWASTHEHLLARIKWLESRVVSHVVRQSKG